MLERINRVNKALDNSPDWVGMRFRLPPDASEWLIETWEQALHLDPLNPPTAPFVPAFRAATGTDGQISWPLNSQYFASEETALEIARRYGDGGEAKYEEVPFGGVGGLFAASANEYHIRVKGELKNAGLIAAFFERNPEDKFPGVADSLIRKALGL